jgi:NAD(P)-dependent dehydrogenase (short-subunit alcohol dehydrogenase family)
LKEEHRQLIERVAIVTGAARGLGQAYCLALAREGAHIVAAAILPCAETVAHVQQAGGAAVGMTVDVADAQSTQAMAAQTLQRFGRMDILVNNVAVYGGLQLTPFEQILEAEWDRVMAVNVKGLWLCCKAVMPTMKQQGYGKIINIASDTIWMGVPLFLHYVASKGAVFAFTRARARTGWHGDYRQHHHAGLHADRGGTGHSRPGDGGPPPRLGRGPADHQAARSARGRAGDRGVSGLGGQGL